MFVRNLVTFSTNYGLQMADETIASCPKVASTARFWLKLFDTFAIFLEPSSLSKKKLSA